MSEIKKMMQNANVKKHWNSTPYGGTEEFYPLFTAEKQLELIKLLCKDRGFAVHYSQDEWGMCTDMHAGYYCEDFEDALAILVNNLWQDLTEEEKQQVKGILE